MSLSEALSTLESAVREVVEAALSDDKTPLRNALALSQAAPTVSSGGDNPDVVIFGDLNGFKGFNDKFGHLAGDAAIGYVGGMIKKFFVDGCKAQAFRPSGDEFVILLSSSQLDQFKTKAPQFASCSFELEEETRKTAMSFGYAVSQGNTGFEDLLKKAETACQIAKSYGDGKWVEWSEEIEQQSRDSLRARCLKCDAKITCNVPTQSIPRDRKLSCCPCCGELFENEESSTLNNEQ